MRIGFTGSRNHLTEGNKKTIRKRLEILAKTATMFITGACLGVDAFIALETEEKYPYIKNIIIVPGNCNLVDMQLLKLKNAHHIYMPCSGSYRERNQMIVDHSDKIEAFWRGNAHSGTWMTINMAKIANKLQKVTIL